MAKSQATTSSLPPPAAGPSTAAMTGRGQARIASSSRSEVVKSSRSCTGSGSPSWSSAPPAQKAPPDPLMTTASASAAPWTAAIIACAISRS